MHVVKLSKSESAKLAIKEVMIFWEKARILTRRDDKCVDKLIKLYDHWRELQKLEKRTSKTEKEKREKFTVDLDMLFDIAHENAIEKLNAEDIEFLLNQRSKAREGCIMGADEKQTKKEKRRADRLEKESARKRKYISQQERERKGNSEINTVIFDSVLFMNVIFVQKALPPDICRHHHQLASAAKVIRIAHMKFRKHAEKNRRSI